MKKIFLALSMLLLFYAIGCSNRADDKPIDSTRKGNLNINQLKQWFSEQSMERKKYGS